MRYVATLKVGETEPHASARCTLNIGGTCPIAHQLRDVALRALCDALRTAPVEARKETKLQARLEFRSSHAASLPPMSRRHMVAFLGDNADIRGIAGELVGQRMAELKLTHLNMAIYDRPLKRHGRFEVGHQTHGVIGNGAGNSPVISNEAEALMTTNDLTLGARL
ncbi:MAG: hypothetical protein AAGJ94_01625 [Pseudomonadota bacterium]